MKEFPLLKIYSRLTNGVFPTFDEAVVEAPVYGVVRVWAFVTHLVTPLMRGSKDVFHLVRERRFQKGMYLVVVHHVSCDSVDFEVSTDSVYVRDFLEGPVRMEHRAELIPSLMSCVEDTVGRVLPIALLVV